MICYAEQYNQLRPAEGKSSESSVCVATLAGFFIGDNTMKVCTVCGKEKPLLEFYKRNYRPCGYKSECKVCSEKHRQTPEGKAAIKRYFQSEKGKAAIKRGNKRYYVNHPEICKAYREKYPIRYAAYILLDTAVENKKIKKPKRCSMCNRETKIQGHHEDYYKPLEVIWVCQICHKKLHKKF